MTATIARTVGIDICKNTLEVHIHPQAIARSFPNAAGKRFIRGGRAHLRQALYMQALVAIRFNADMKAKYQALIAAGKPPKVAITAAMRKLAILANALLRDQRNWMPKTA